MESARVIATVQAGVIPGQPEPAYTKQFSITSQQWEDAGLAGGQLKALVALSTQVTEYEQNLHVSIHKVNWVNAEWIYL